MKKFMTIFVATVVAVCTYGGVRVADRASDTSGDATISVGSKHSRVASIVCDVTDSGQTNTFTVTSTSIFTAAGTAYTNTYELAPQVVAVQGSEVVAYYNVDNDDGQTDSTPWLKPYDVVTLSGSTTCVYKVVFEEI